MMIGQPPWLWFLTYHTVALSIVHIQAYVHKAEEVPAAAANPFAVTGW